MQRRPKVGLLPLLIKTPKVGVREVGVREVELREAVKKNIHIFNDDDSRMDVLAKVCKVAKENNIY